MRRRFSDRGFIWIAVTGIAFLLGISPGSRGQTAAQAGKPELNAEFKEGWEFDLALLADQLPKLHKDLFFKTTPEQFRKRVEALKSRLEKLSREEFAVGLARIVASAGDAHTSLSLPVLNAFPVMLYWFKEGIFVVNTTREYESALYGRIAAVNGTPIKTVADAFASIIPCENDSQFRHALPRLLASAGHLQGLGLSGDAKAAAFTIETEKGETIVLKMNAAPLRGGAAPAWLDNSKDVPLYRRHGDQAYWMEVLPEEKIVYFKYNSCRDMPAKPFAGFQQELLKAISGPGIERLIIDLRNNGGGNSGLLDPFIGALSGTEFGKTKGKLYVIIGRQTFSSALLNAIDLRKKTGAIFVGEPTGGKPNHYGEIRTLVLPRTKLPVSYSTKYFRTVEGDPESLVPDRAVAFSIADYRARRDPFLEAILAPAIHDQAPDSFSPDEEIDGRCKAVEARVIAWRRDIHEHPELGNREFRTSKLVADHLRSLGLEVRTGIARTGVVGVLRGGLPGPVVALRADMDALPVKEMTGLPFASKAKAMIDGREVEVMHACGHDAHTAILMGAAEVLAGLKNSLPGTVTFIFQPAEEGAPAGEAGGAESMIKQGALDHPKPDAIFGLHVFPFRHGALRYRSGAFMAAGDGFSITVKGRQTHGAMPWGGTDPIVVAAQIILGLQTIVSRMEDLTRAPAVITVGVIQAGIRTNIIPQEATFSGTIRTLDPGMRREIRTRVRMIAEGIARSAGAEADVSIREGLPVLMNDPSLTARMIPVLERVSGKDLVSESPPQTTSEDFAYYGRIVPAMFFFLGINAENADPAKVFPNHSPYFTVAESALLTGVRAFVHLTLARMAEK